MKLYVDTEDHGTVCVEVQGSDMIRDVRRKIWERIGCDLYWLVYNSTLLPDDHTVSQCGLYDGCSVKGRLLRWIAVVTDCGEEIELFVWRDATVGEVKGMVEKNKGIPAAHQVLKYKGEELRDERTMEGCGVWDLFSSIQLQLVTREPAQVASSAPELTRGSAETAAAAATTTASDKQDKISQISTKQEHLEQRVSTVESAVKENHQEVGQRCRDLSETDQLLAGRVAAIELENKNMKEDIFSLEKENKGLKQNVKTLDLENKRMKQNVATLQTQVSTDTQKRSQNKGTIKQKFDRNFTKFFDIDLGVADKLYEASVLSQVTYDFIFDRNTQFSTAERVREMLRKVMKSENNIKEFRQALLDQGDSRSKELAALLL